MSNEPLIAVFIDYENLALGVRDLPGDTDSLQVGLVLNRLLEKGRIVYKRAYCDWSHYRRAGKALHQQGVTMVDIPQTGVSGKNSADIHMVVDAVDLCFSKPHIEIFALLSGDSDFSPLVHKLKECNKRVIGCGVKRSTSSLLVKGCDSFIYYDDLVSREAARPRKKRRNEGSKGGDNREPTRADARDETRDQVLEVVRALAEDYENVWGSMVKQTMGRLYPSFSFQRQGFKTFNEVLKDIEKTGLIKLHRDRERGNYLVELKEG